MRHHERGFAFAIDESDAPTDTYGLLLRYRARGRPRQFLSSAVPFENSEDVLRRVRSRRADVSGPLRPGLPEETSRRGTTGGPRHRTMHVLRLVPAEIGLVQDRPRTRAHETTSRGDPEALAVGTGNFHPRRPRRGREQPLADRQVARTVRGSAVRPGLSASRARQAVSLRFVREAAGSVLRRRLAGPRRRPRTHAAGNARRTNVRDRPRGPKGRSGGLRLAHRGSPRRARLLPEHQRTRQGARPRALGFVRGSRVLVPEAVRPEAGPRGLSRNVPRPPRSVPHRRRRATQGIPRRGDVGPTVRRPERLGDRRVAALQAERCAKREARRRGAGRGEDRTHGVRTDRPGPSGVRGSAARAALAERPDGTRGRRVDPGRGVLVAPSAGEFEALKGAATLSTQ